VDYRPGRAVAASVFAAIFLSCAAAGGGPTAIFLDTPQSPPTWALLERELLRASSSACEEFFQRFFDERGWLECVERWGGDDGPDDAIENLADWPLLHALGAPDAILELYKKGWEGHLRQYTLARTVDVPFARDGMYYKEFPVMFDWLHHGEGLTVFNYQGLSDPRDERFRARTRRFAGFYMNEDPQALNYDPEKRIIRSLFNGSRGPLLRPATALDWAGDPIEVEGRFRLGHGERSYREMLEHFKDYTDIVGDHPQNLGATTLALNAFLLDHEEKYKRWILEYVDAWLERMAKNGGIIPTNIGLDGTIGGSCGGKWYGGTYGWGFSVVVPQTGAIDHRNHHELGLVGFGNAFLLTGERKYLDAWRRMIDAVNAQGKLVDGEMSYPTMYGDQGWYAYKPQPYRHGAFELWYWSMDPADRARLASDAWLEYLEGKRPTYPEEALRGDLARVREKVAAMRRDASTPDTRLADDPMQFNPAAVESLVRLALGGLYPGHRSNALHCRLRYFDPMRRRAGLPEDVAALVDGLSGDGVAVTLVNVSQLSAREVIVQAGAYGEHQITAVEAGSQSETWAGSWVPVRLAPGAGGRIRLQMKRYVNVPSLVFPWDRN